MRGSNGHNEVRVMNRREAWAIVSEQCDDGYDGSEYEEMKEVIDEFWKARAIVARSMKRKWWQFWI